MRAIALKPRSRHLSVSRKALCLGDLLDIAELHQRVQETKRGGVVDAGGARDLREPHFGPFGREGLEHAKALRERLHGILFRNRWRLFAHFRSPAKSSDSELKFI